MLEGLDSLVLGPVTAPNAAIGPVISEQARDSIRGALAASDAERVYEAIAGRRVIELAAGKIVRDEQAGAYASRENTREFAARMDDPDALGTMGYAIRINNLKVNASVALVDIVQGAMVVAGIAGYRTDTPVTLGRHLRDALGALVMINNDRIVAANASLLLASRED